MIIDSKFIEHTSLAYPPITNYSAFKEQPWLKYVQFEQAVDVSTPDITSMLLRMSSEFTSLEDVLVDVKPMFVVSGKTPCIPGWHFDGARNPQDAKPAHNMLLVFGDHCLTEFVVGKFRWIEDHFGKEDPPFGIPVKRIRDGVPTSYDEFGFHRGVKAIRSGPRLLIRLSKTKLIRPRAILVKNNPMHLKFHLYENLYESERSSR